MASSDEDHAINAIIDRAGRGHQGRRHRDGADATTANAGDGSGDTEAEVEVETTGQAFTAPVLADAAMPGPWEQLVRLWEPWTEAHPASIVLPALVMLGIHGGEGVRVGQQRPVEYLAVIGPSTVGRKDTGAKIAAEFAELCGGRRPTYGQPNSGEGVWFAMRDPLDTDPGADDKRLVLLDTEMAATLAASHRGGATVLPALLSLYDTGNREPLTKRDRVRVTNGMFGYVGLTVPEQFTLHVTDADRHSGLLQRLLIAAVHRVRLVPPSRALNPAIDPRDIEALAEIVRDRMEAAVSRGRIWRLSRAAAEHFDAIAGELVDPARPETTRGAPHVLRLATIYALTVPPDPTDAEERTPGLVTLSHLCAGHAAWRYCSESAALLLTNDNLLDKIVALAADRPFGVNKTDLFRSCGNNVTATELNNAIHRGRLAGRLKVFEMENGRPGRNPIMVRAV